MFSLTLLSLSQLLSLAGRHSVLVSQIVTELWRMPSSQAHNPTIDMQQVQSLVDEMGTSLSPGAQNLMDMVRVQQLVSRHDLIMS